MARRKEYMSAHPRHGVDGSQLGDMANRFAPIRAVSCMALQGLGRQAAVPPELRARRERVPGAPGPGRRRARPGGRRPAGSQLRVVKGAGALFRVFQGALRSKVCQFSGFHFVEKFLLLITFFFFCCSRRNTGQASRDLN